MIDLTEFDKLEALISTRADLERSHSGEIVELFDPPTLPWQLNAVDDEGDAPIALFDNVYNADMFHWLWHHRHGLVTALREKQGAAKHAEMTKRKKRRYNRAHYRANAEELKGKRRARYRAAVLGKGGPS